MGALVTSSSDPLRRVRSCASLRPTDRPWWGEMAQSSQESMTVAVLPSPIAPRAAPATGYVPPYVRRVREEAARARITLLARAARPAGPRTPILIAVVRNESAVLADFLEHYRSLGVERFALIDNGSTDATRDLLGPEPDVDLYSVIRPFSGKQGWVNALIARYGYDRWYLHVDADEHLVFDGAPGRTLADLIAFATARGLRRVRGVLVDMYSPGPLLAVPPANGQSLEARFRLFDGDRLRRGALPRADLAQGRATAASVLSSGRRLRPRADQVPAVPDPPRRGGGEPAPPTSLPRQLPLGLLSRAPALQVRRWLPRQGRAGEPRG